MSDPTEDELVEEVEAELAGEMMFIEEMEQVGDKFVVTGYSRVRVGTRLQLAANVLEDILSGRKKE